MKSTWLKSSFDTSLSESSKIAGLLLIRSVNWADDCGIEIKGGKPSFVDFEVSGSTMLPVGGMAATMFGNFPGTAAATANICGVYGIDINFQVKELF